VKKTLLSRRTSLYPQVFLRRDLGLKTSAKQNNAFCFFFWKKKDTIRPISFLGASPQTPRVGFAEFWGWNRLLRSRTNAFCFFFWKKKDTIRPISFLGASPQTLRVGFAEIGGGIVFWETELTLLASFSGKRRFRKCNQEAVGPTVSLSLEKKDTKALFCFVDS
jgi:hypothetical protein